MSSRPGSARSIAHELVRLYRLRLAIVVPLLVALGVGVVAGLSAPGGLANDTQHEHWKDLFGTSGQIIATLLVALVVEMHVPFTRSGRLAIRFPVMLFAAILATAGLAAVIALSPALPGCVYQILMGLTLGGAAGGFAAVVLLGISVILGTLRKVDQQALERLRELGDPSAAEDLFRRRGL